MNSSRVCFASILALVWVAGCEPQGSDASEEIMSLSDLSPPLGPPPLADSLTIEVDGTTVASWSDVPVGAMRFVPTAAEDCLSAEVLTVMLAPSVTLLFASPVTVGASAAPLLGGSSTAVHWSDPDDGKSYVLLDAEPTADRLDTGGWTFGVAGAQYCEVLGFDATAVANPVSCSSPALVSVMAEGDLVDVAGVLDCREGTPSEDYVTGQTLPLCGSPPEPTTDDGTGAGWFDCAPD